MPKTTSSNAAPLLCCALAAAIIAAPAADARAQVTQPGSAPDFETAESDVLLAPPPGPPRQIASWDEALALIRAQSPEYLSSAASVTRAEAQRRLALSAVLPTLNGLVTYTHQFSTLPVTLGGQTVYTPLSDVWFAGASLAWTPVNPRGIYGLGTADKVIESAHFSFQDARRAIARALVDAMLATLAAQRVADLNRVGLRAALDRLGLTRARLEFGQGTLLDVDRAEQDAAAARAVIITGDESLRQARESLGVALGSPVAIAPPGSIDIEPFEAAVARTCRLNEDIERRPDVAAARLRFAIARRAIRDAELQIAPTLGVVSQVGYASEVLLAPKYTWAVQGVLTLPLYDGGARYSALRDAQAALEQTREALATTRLAAIVESAQAKRSVGVVEASREVARTRRDLAKRIDGRTREGYAHGLGTSLDLVTSAEALRQTEINLALLEFQVGSARAHAVLADAECDY